jgi:arylsulfatase A
MTRRTFLMGMAQARTPLNVIVILADDLGYSELGCYGNRFNSTPHLDRLAREGVRFTQAYAAAPVCSPMRASYMTGQYPARVGINDYLRADDAKFLSPSIETLPKQFARAGYETALIGKWHLMGDYKTRKGDPKLHGFKQVICSESSYIGPGYYFPPYKHMMEIEPRTPGEYLTDRLNQEAVEFIERTAGKPFYLTLNHYSPHTKLVGKPALVAKYAAKAGAGKKTNNAELAAMLESIDDGVGMIVAALDRLKLTSHTLVLFTSDNGGETTVTTNAPLRGGKSQLYEGGIREPMIVKTPGMETAGRVCDVPVSSIDFYPTLLDAAGLHLPRGHRVDGVSFLPCVMKIGATLPPRPLFWYFPLDKPHFLGGRSAAAIRKGDFKLIQFLDDGAVELYNLKDDVGEAKNLAGAMPGKVAELRGELERWRASVGAA